MYEVIAGRTEPERQQYGLRASFLVGKHYVTMGTGTSLANEVYIDANRSHVIFIVGKRGSGKSYTMGSMVESMAALPIETKQNISIILLDTMGIYWTMKYENTVDRELLEKWGLRPENVSVNLFVPTGYYEKYLQQGIPADKSFAFKPSELTAQDWCSTFSISMISKEGILITRIVASLENEPGYTLDTVLQHIQKDNKTDEHTKTVCESLFLAAQQWGLFSETGTSIEELTAPGKISVLDVSCYAAEHNSTSIRSLVIGLLSQKIFDQRMISRKKRRIRIGSPS